MSKYDDKLASIFSNIKGKLDDNEYNKLSSLIHNLVEGHTYHTKVYNETEELLGEKTNLEMQIEKLEDEIADIEIANFQYLDNL